MVLRCGGVPQNPLVSDRIQRFCDAVCTPESTSFGLQRVLQGVGVPGVPHNPPISDRIKGFCDSGLSDAKTPAARIPFPPAGNVKKRMACRAGSKDHSGRTLPVGGKGGTVARLGAVTKLRRLLANACDELQGKVLRTSSWPNLPSVEL